MPLRNRSPPPLGESRPRVYAKAHHLNNDVTFSRGRPAVESPAGCAARRTLSWYYDVTGPAWQQGPPALGGVRTEVGNSLGCRPTARNPVPSGSDCLRRRVLFRRPCAPHVRCAVKRSSGAAYKGFVSEQFRELVGPRPSIRRLVNHRVLKQYIS